MRTSAHGLSVEVPHGWEARIVRRAHSAPYLHVANFALKADAGQFGAAVTGRMGPDSVFAALVEYLVDEDVAASRGLFAARWRPRVGLHELRPNQLQVTRSGHLGVQRFFTAAGRPYCLYAVIAPVRRRPAQLTGAVSAVLKTVRFEPRPSG
jgi:hypothetical protein